MIGRFDLWVRGCDRDGANRGIGRGHEEDIDTPGTILGLCVQSRGNQSLTGAARAAPVERFTDEAPQP